MISQSRRKRRTTAPAQGWAKVISSAALALALVMPGAVAAGEKPTARPTRSILKKSDAAASNSADRVESLSVSGGHKLTWRSAAPKQTSAAAVDSQVTPASATEPVAAQPIRKPTAAERAKRRNEILQLRAERPQELEEEVTQAAHLQPVLQPRNNAAAPDDQTPTIEELMNEPTEPAEEVVDESAVPMDEAPMDEAAVDEAAIDETQVDETAPAAPSDLPGDMSDEQPSPLEGTVNDPFRDDQIPGAGDGTPGNGQFQLEEGDQKGATGTEGCEDDKKECRDSFRLIKSTTLDRISLDIRITGTEGKDFPCQCSIGDEQFAGRNWACLTYNWTASALCHKPLYFEEVGLERYGHSWNPLVQPIISGAHFFATFPVLPYKMGLKPPQECVYTLGYYRPGNCAPYLVPPIPFSLRAAAAEAAFVGGAIAIIP